MGRAEVGGSIGRVVEVPKLAGKDLIPAASTRRESGRDDRGELPAATLVVGAIAAGVRGASAFHAPPCRAALRFSRRRSTFAASRAA